MDGYMLSCCVLFALFLRCGVSLNSYSGANMPPMFGDYEAQRHWMEITHNLLVDEWYNQTKDNDLFYWGLDYPPLTAYHAKICGYIASLVNSDWVALNTSRGYESYDHKLFMRTTVLVADVLIYFLAVIAFVKTVLKKNTSYEQLMFCTMILCYPGLILVDHGHFQYNCISLGFTILSSLFMMKRSHLLASVFFVLALNYKQMALYHSFPFFFYLLSVSWKQKSWLLSFVKLSAIGASVIATFIICWMPFLKDIESAKLVLFRLFPFNRGLFEDKVANVWCAVSVVVKIKTILSQPRMVQLCLVSTLLACVPSCFDLLRNGTRKKFLYAMINCSLAFFLFSYQVHEKSILIPATSVCLVLWMNPLAASWFLLISTFSMYPLLVRDGQTVSYFALNVLYLLMASVLCSSKQYSRWIKLGLVASLSGCVVLHIGFASIKPPASLPDLYPLLFSVYSCAHFVLFWLFFLYIQWTSPDVDLTDVFSDRDVSLKKKFK